MTRKKKITRKSPNLKAWTDINNQPYARNGTYITIGHKASLDSEEVIDLFYTNRAPKLKFKGQEIDVEYSSTEQDDQNLLHFLAGKV